MGRWTWIGIAIASVLVVASVVTCQSVLWAPAVALPQRSQIDAVSVTLPRASEPPPMIADPTDINQAFGIVSSLNHHWKRTWHTYPIPQRTIAFYSTGELVMVVYVGTDWIGMRGAGEGAGDNRIRPIRESEQDDIAFLMSLSAD